MRLHEPDLFPGREPSYRTHHSEDRNAVEIALAGGSWLLGDVAADGRTFALKLEDAGAYVVAESVQGKGTVFTRHGTLEEALGAMLSRDSDASS